MSKLKTKIDEKRIARLKMIMSKEKIAQNELAEKIGVTQQNLSRIMCKKQGLTESLAIRIIDEYPDYSVAWLLGYDEVRWISVKDRLPKKSGYYLVAIEGFIKNISVHRYNASEDYWSGAEAGSRIVNITHWTPLPESPKEEN